MNFFARSGQAGPRPQGTSSSPPGQSTGPGGPRSAVPHHQYTLSAPAAPYPQNHNAHNPGIVSSNPNANINSNGSVNPYTNANGAPHTMAHQPPRISSPPLVSHPSVSGAGNRPHSSWTGPPQAQGATQHQHQQHQQHQHPQHPQHQQHGQFYAQQQPHQQQHQQQGANAALTRMNSTSYPGMPQRTPSNPHPWAIPLVNSNVNASTTTVSTVGRPSVESGSTGESATHGAGGRRIHERYEQRFMYIYNATIAGVSAQFIVTVEAAPLTPDESVVTLTFKSGGIERSICGKEYMRLNVDPSTLHFHIFVFPKPSLPADCLFCVRVWLESQQVQHRIFSDDNLWVGKDPPFASIPHVALTQLGAPTIPFPSRNEVGVIRRAYKGFVGRAACDFVIIMKNLSTPDSVWGITMEYQAGGVSRLVFEEVKLRFHCRLEDIKFIIYSVPIDSSIPYSNHRLRVWAKGLDGVHHRLFKSDEFRIGSQLAFQPLTQGPGGVVFATRDASSPTIALHSSLLHSEPPKAALMAALAAVDSASEAGTVVASTSTSGYNGGGGVGTSGTAGTLSPGVGPTSPGVGTGPGTGAEARTGTRPGSGGSYDDRADREYEERRMGISIGIGNGNSNAGGGANVPFDESLPSYSVALGVGI